MMAATTPISRKPLSFVLPIMGAVGLLVGLLVGTSNGISGMGALIGVVIFTAICVIAIRAPLNEKGVRWFITAAFFLAGWGLNNIALGLLGGFIGAFTGWFIFWLYEGRYRMR